MPTNPAHPLRIYPLTDMTVAEYSDLLSREPLRVREEMSELRHEFESYKQKAQSVLRAKSSKV